MSETHTNPLPDPFTELDTTRPSPGLPLESVDETKPPVEPAIDIGEDQYEYLFVVEVPGIAMDDLEVAASGRVLEVRGTAKMRASEQSKRFVHVERELGDSHRAFTLPEDADVEGLHYDSLDGVLHVHVPKIRMPGVEPDDSELLLGAKEKEIPEARPHLEPDLAMVSPNLVRTIVGEQPSASGKA